MKSLHSTAAGLIGVLLLLPACTNTVAPASPPQPPPPPAAEAAPAVVAVAVSPAPPPNPGASPEVMRRLPALPEKSPRAEVFQEVGITDIHVSYASPGARGRTVWGDLVPYGERWRTGANAPTRVTFEHEVSVGGAKVPAGSYTLMTVPTADKWTVILNKDVNNQGVYAYDEAQNVATLEVTPTDAPSRERLTFVFEDTTDEGTKLVLDWAGKRVAIPIAVDTKTRVKESIDATMAAAWRPLFNAGRYALEQDDLEGALALFEKSVGIHGSWWNHWWAATTLQKLGKNAEARAHAEKAKKLGEGDAVYDRAFAEQVNKALAEWPQS